MTEFATFIQKKAKFDYAVAAGLARSEKEERDRNQARFEGVVALRQLNNLREVRE